MNLFTPAYSVPTLVLVALGLTLTGLPVSVVLAQEDAAVVTDVASTTTSLDASSTQTVPSGASVYPIETLLSDRVYSDFVVGPGRFQLEVAPGESRTVEMTVTNRMGIPKTFSLSTEDMSGTSDADNAVVLLGDQVGPYSIKDYITVPQTKFVLNHAEQVRIPVTVRLPADAEPGGFYGSLLTEIVSDDVDVGNPDGTLSGSKIISRIGTLFFVTTPGAIDRSLELKEFSTLGDKKFYTKGPIDFNVVTENTGSVHVTPYGELRIFNTLGNEVGFVELQPWYVLPKAVRNKEMKWNREFLVGRYTAVLELNRGYENITDKVSYSFWVIPLELVGGVFAGFFVLFIIIRFFFSRFEFKRKGS